MKYSPPGRSKSLLFTLLAALMITSFHTVEAASQKQDLFSMLGDVEHLFKSILEPKPSNPTFNFEETVMKDDHSKNSTRFEHFLRAHLVGEDIKIYNLWSEKYFTATIYNVYLTAFQSGLKLSSFYDYSTQCISGFQALMDSVYFLQKNYTSV